MVLQTHNTAMRSFYESVLAVESYILASNQQGLQTYNRDGYWFCYIIYKCYNCHSNSKTVKRHIDDIFNVNMKQMKNNYTILCHKNVTLELLDFIKYLY